jgi:hypothetical protein
MALETPFGFSDGAPFVIYAENLVNTVRFFDSSETLFHAMGRGIKSFHVRRYQPLKSIAKKHGVFVNESGEIEGYFPPDKMAFGFARYISALLDFAKWEDEYVGVDLSERDGQLVNETKMYMALLFPGKPIAPSLVTMKGLSGKVYGFDLDQDGTQIDAISAHPNAASAELYKLVDLSERSSTTATKVTVVIDDRGTAAEQAKQELAVIGQYAETWPMTKLIHAAAQSKTSG